MKSNRITEKFQELKASGKKGLITYMTAGDPNLETNIEIASIMESAGADLIEIGIPFSDPVADGPSIQQASIRSLSKGITMLQIIETIGKIRQRVKVPLIIMTYYNPILQYGLEKFVVDAVLAGVDGIIVPDLPFEECGQLFDFTDSAGLCLIQLVAPTTTDGRMEKIFSRSRGFIYCVSVTGITGIRNEINTDLRSLTARISKYTTLPIAIGFGIGGPLQAGMVAHYCDAVVVGSALVDTIAYAKDSQTMLIQVNSLIKDIKTALS
ncbi:MAG TPA: tryptophan synthase subunit alpha [Desulfotomaculum sp.]|nr:tryptophan synthase subunit alpha [Desulfotomaculum sp.]